jgi:hypothetical protein
MPSDEARKIADLTFLAESANRCFAAAELCEASLAAIGLRELAEEYLALATKIQDGTAAASATSMPRRVSFSVGGAKPEKLPPAPMLPQANRAAESPAPAPAAET